MYGLFRLKEDVGEFLKGEIVKVAPVDNGDVHLAVRSHLWFSDDLEDENPLVMLLFEADMRYAKVVESQLEPYELPLKKGDRINLKNNFGRRDDIEGDLVYLGYVEGRVMGIAFTSEEYYDSVKNLDLEDVNIFTLENKFDITSEFNLEELV